MERLESSADWHPGGSSGGGLLASTGSVREVVFVMPHVHGSSSVAAFNSVFAVLLPDEFAGGWARCNPKLLGDPVRMRTEEPIHNADAIRQKDSEA
jgi:hypothetical protein